MKRYEGLFILNTAGKEDGIKETIDKIAAEIGNAGGKVETVQKMDKKSFARVADKRHPSGYYVNIIFEAPSTAVSQIQTRLSLSEDVFRTMFSVAPKVPQPA